MKDHGLECRDFTDNSPISTVPSWSWMAFTGGIDYFKPDFGSYHWESVTPPWASGGDGNNGITLVANAQGYDHRVMEHSPKETMFVFDQAQYLHTKKTLCVVLGTEKKNVPAAFKKHYLLLVRPTIKHDRTGLKIYQRVGAGFLLGKHIIEGKSRIAIQ